jgi:glycosyltransferase involved in cell wall biosynthesis
MEVPTIKAAGISHIPVRMTRNPFTPLQDLKALWQLYHIIRRERFTIVHTHNPKPGFLGQIAAKMAGVPIIVNTLHGFYFHDNMHSALRRFYTTLEKIAARCSDAILSQNREDIETAIREGICPPEKIKYLGNGIDVQRFNPTRFSLQDIARKRLEVGLPSGVRVVGFVGRLVREKGLLELFAAARLVREKVSDVHFLFIGPVDTEKPDALTPETARDYSIADICHFLGMRQDMPELYALIDVFVLPSHREGFPRAPMEASAMKVPCVVTNIRGCREAVEHGRNGLLVPLGDVQALADAIIELLTDREKARRMGEEGRCMALERFDERLVFEKVKAEYARLLRAKGLPVPKPRE